MLNVEERIMIKELHRQGITINERQIHELATVRFVASGENVLLLGPHGVGKIHLVAAIGDRLDRV